ncbi:non-ribosomal peptide synthetase [Aliikangiella sp. G2MR2-5]|uniref:non-ribosomal peptide synthetase n=1 Tax=Aliikangiella sp. G2MR2-5 TaxID=2788943 RepID=UPI0018A9284D|nr:non-ribosomal peptide synthetase [Aliikangiella sp. G2MR2-5]
MDNLIIRKTLLDLANNNVSVGVNANNLVVTGALETVSSETKQFLVQNKQAVIEYLKGLDYSDSITPVVDSYSDAIPLSYSQQRLWLVDELGQDNSIYNMPFTLKVTGDFNISVAEEAIRKIIERHAILRTGYGINEGVPFQKINSDFNFRVGCVDLSTYDKKEQVIRVNEFISEDNKEPFRLDGGLMVRASYLLLDKNSDTKEGILQFNMHHIASDAWSIGVLVREFLEFYQQLLAGQKIKAKPLSIQYADYAIWQRKEVDSNRLQKQQVYWENQLEDVPLTHNLPLDFNRPSVKKQKGKLVSSKIPLPTLKLLNKLANECDTTLFVVLHAVLAFVLTRFSGEKEIVIGTSVANRRLPELEDLIGFFINTLVLRTSCDFTDFKRYLAHVKEVNFDAQSNQDIPFEKILDLCKIPREAQHTPLYQIVFTMNNTESFDMQFENTRFELYGEGYSVAKFDLEVGAQVHDSGIEFKFWYDCSIFTEDSIRSIASCFEHVLHVVAENSNIEMAKISLVSSEQQCLLTESIICSGAQNEKGNLAHQLVEKQAEKVPDAIAVRHYERTITYGELNKAANQLAQFLVEEDVQVGDVIGIPTNRSIEMVIAMLGALKAGAAYLPIDTSLPKERLNFQIAHAGLEMILVWSDLISDLPIKGVDFVDLDEITSGGFSAYSSENPNIESLTYENLAYILYTSGTTGNPKGVAVEHRNFVHYLQHCLSSYFDRHIAGAIVSTPTSFDATVTSLFSPLTAGKTVVLLSDCSEKLFSELSTYLFESEQNWLFKLTPAHLNTLLKLEDKQTSVSAQHVIVIGGEQLTYQCLEPWVVQCLPGSLFINEYGPTETVVGCTTYSINSDTNLKPRSPIPIGKPINATRLYILDDYGKLLPRGAKGELFIGGGGVARGYLNSPDMTRERFVESPFVDGDRLYRTGDLVRYSEEGDLIFLGRKDQQVKFNGYRIELEDISANICRSPFVKEAIADVDILENGKQQLIVFVLVEGSVFASDHSSLIEELRGIAKQNLPSYMLPSSYIILESWPLTSHGKINRSALPRNNVTLVEHNDKEPANKIEFELLEIWKELLQNHEVGVNDNFFSLGGDSILAIQVSARASRKNIRVSTKLIFEYQTIRTLAKQVEGNSETRASAINSEVTGKVDLTPIQKLFLNSGYPKDCLVQNVLLNVPLELDGDILAKMVYEILARHDALRTMFKSCQGEIQALENYSAKEFVSEIDVQNLDEQTLQSIYCEQLKHIKPESGYLTRFVLIKSGLQRRLLWLTHHLVVDGVSWRILVEDLGVMWSQYANGEAFDLGQKTSSLKDWGAALKNYVCSDRLREESNYWQTKNKQLVENFPSPLTAENLQWQTRSFSLSREITKKLLLRDKEHNQLSDDMILLTAFSVAFERSAKYDSISIFVETHGREELDSSVDLSQTVGWFTSLYPIHLVVSDTISERLISVKEQFNTPCDKGLGYSVLSQLESDTPVDFIKPEVIFNYLGQFELSKEQGMDIGLAKESVNIISDEAFFLGEKLSINAMVVDGRVQFGISFEQNAVAPSLIEEIVVQLEACLAEVIAVTNNVEDFKHPSDYPLARLTIDELAKLSTEFKVDDIYRATGVQSGLLYHSELSKEAYVNQMLLTIDDIQEEIFKEAWNKIIDRYDILRTAFVLTEAGYHQVVTSPNLDWQVINISDLSQDEQYRYIDRARIDDRAKGFDFRNPPLMRFRLFRLAENSYRLLWSHHHVLWDGWCNSLIYNEVISIYHELQSLEQLSIQPRAQYKQYISWLERANSSKAIDYWTSYLSKIENVSHFPQQTLGDLVGDEKFELSLGKVLTSKLNEYAKAHHCTLSALVHAAWACLLSYYTGESKVLFGSVISGRPTDLPGVEDIIGVFINTIPVIVELNQDELLGDLVNNIQSDFNNSNEFGYLPLAEIQACSSFQSLFDSIVVFENFSSQKQSGGQGKHGRSLTKEMSSFETSNYPITLVVFGSEELAFRLQVKEKQFERRIIENVLHHLRNLFESIVEPGHQKLDKLVMLSEHEIHLLRNEYNNTQRDYQFEQCLEQLFVEKVKDNPENIALVDEQGSLTYAELFCACFELSERLASLNLHHEELVAIRLPKGRWQLIATLGVMMSGVAYLPLELSWPDERCENIVKRAGCRFVLVLDDSLALSSTQPVVLDVTREINQSYIDEVKKYKPMQRPADLAYVIFTSGSTGTPKGVAIEHRSAVNTILDINQEYGVSQQDKVLAVSALSFDLSVYDLFGLLAVGGTIVFPHDRLAKDPSHWLDMIEKHQVTIWDTVPVSAGLLVEQLEMSQRQSTAPLRCVMMSGDWINPALPKRIWNVFPEAKTYSLGGATEGSIWSIHHPITYDTSSLKSVPYGKPLGNQKFFILNGNQQLSPIGVVGELCIGGEGVARCYYGDERLSQERFIYHEELQQKLYRTGDLGRYLSDGNIEFIGRVDHQVKINGFRIELGEIEQRLNACKDVESCLVLARENSHGTKYLVAFVKLVNNKVEAEFKKQLKQLLQNELPDYMVPNHYVFVEQWPLTANGKVDLKALPKSEEFLTSDEYQPVKGELEYALLNIWAELLEVEKERISAIANFLEIGGHSLLAVRMVAKIEQQLEVKISLHELYSYNSIRTIAGLIDKKMALRKISETISEMDEAEIEEFSL